MLIFKPEQQLLYCEHSHLQAAVRGIILVLALICRS